jgi:hypothetical protein
VSSSAVSEIDITQAQGGGEPQHFKQTMDSRATVGPKPAEADGGAKEDQEGTKEE